MHKNTPKFHDAHLGPISMKIISWKQKMQKFVLKYLSQRKMALSKQNVQRNNKLRLVTQLKDQFDMIIEIIIL